MVLRDRLPPDIGGVSGIRSFSATRVEDAPRRPKEGLPGPEYEFAVPRVPLRSAVVCGGSGKSGTCTPEAKADRFLAEVATLLGVLTLTCSDFAQTVRSKRLSSTRGVVQFAEQMKSDCEKAAASVAEVKATKAIHRWSSAQATLIDERDKGRRMVDVATSPLPLHPRSKVPRKVRGTWRSRRTR